MGFAVVHLEKAKGSDSGMSAHIERSIAPKNADVGRSHLNREMIEFPDGVTNRTEAIQHRLETAGLKRKIASNQVRAIRVMLSGTHEDMKQIEYDGKLDKWCGDNLGWLRQTFGIDNVVSAVLHLDEKTPHIHATVVPIVTNERKRRKREERVTKKYSKKHPAPRLCADEVMSRIALKGYQDSYANVMSKYGLLRGIDGSEAKHISTSQYYRDLQQQSESLQEDISELLSQQEQMEKELATTKANINKEKLKNSAADVGSKLLDGASSLFGTPKVKRLEQENEQLKKDIVTIKEDIKLVKQESLEKFDDYKKAINAEWNKRLIEFGKREASILKEKKRLQKTLDKIFELFPKVQELLRIEALCRAMGFTGELLKRLLNMEKVTFSGALISTETKDKYHTDNSTAQVFSDSRNTNQLSLKIDSKDHSEWFKEQQHRRMYLGQSRQDKNRRIKI